MTVDVQQSTATDGTTRGALVLNKGSLGDERSNSTVGDSYYGGPAVSQRNPGSFEQQVKRAIEEGSLPGKAKLGRQLLKDQEARLNSIKPMTDTSEQNLSIYLGTADRLGVISRATSSFMERDHSMRSALPAVSKLHYTPSGRKLHDMSIQAVVTQNKLGSASNLEARTGASHRSSQIQQRGESSVLGALGRLQNAIKTAPITSKGIQVGSAPKTVNGALGPKSKLLTGSASILGSKLVLTSNVGSGSTGMSGGAKFIAGSAETSESVPFKSRTSAHEVRALAQGSIQTFAGSKMIYSGSSSRTKLSTESSKLTGIQGDLISADSAKLSLVRQTESNVMSISRGLPGSEEQSSRSIQPGFNIINNGVPQGTGTLGSSFVKYKLVRESMNVFDVAQTQLKHRKKSSKIHHMPVEVIQAVSGHAISPSGNSAKCSGRKPPIKKGQPAPAHRISSSSKNAPASTEESKTVLPTDSLMEKMLKYCYCSDVEVPVEEKISELKFDFTSFKQSNENVAAAGPKIVSVARSPFERKDRAARAAFAKELEQVEIAAIEKKQRLKPKKIKKELKKVGVYDTIKHVCHIPDSYADSLRGSPLCPSRETGVLETYISSPSRSDAGSSLSPKSSIIEDKLQLRKDNSLASRNIGGELNREEAFHEIELSEESDCSHRSVASSSPDETISSSSEISLRVNLDRTPTHEECKAMRLRNAPFVDYQNTIKGEQVLSNANKSNVKILDANLEGIIIEKIATEFGEWAKENGVKPEAVEKDVIKELFQFGTMDTAANSIAVEIKELIIVPESITNGMHPHLEERAAMYRQILFDECAYWRTERSMAFGKPDPNPYKRPPHPPLPTWTESGFVPQPLATGELLYQTLIDNDSLMLERYVLWMVDNPRQYRPPYLLKCGYFQKVVDKHGGSEEAIRHNSTVTKMLSAEAGKNMAGLNCGMQNDLRKLKEMSEVGKKSYAQG